jgi:MFS family permease
VIVELHNIIRSPALTPTTDIEHSNTITPSAQGPNIRKTSFGRHEPAPLSVASAAIALITPVWGIYAFMLLLGISNGFTSTLLGALWPEVYGLANLGGIRAITVSGMVLASALGPGITGALIDMGIPLPTQMLWMAAWCVLASLALAMAANKVRAREMRRKLTPSHLQQT